jgi:hypothetical protein
LIFTIFIFGDIFSAFDSEKGLSSVYQRFGACSSSKQNRMGCPAGSGLI